MTDDNALPPEQPRPPSPWVGLRRPLFTLGVLVFVWLVFGKIVPYFIFPHHAPIVENNAPVNAVPTPADNPLDERVSLLEAKVKTLEDALAAQPKVTVDNTPVVPPAEIAADKEHVSHLETSLNQQAESLQALKNQVADLQTHQAQKLTALTVFGELKDAVMRGDAFNDALAQLTKFTADNNKAQDLLKQLEPQAAQGIGALAGLQGEFGTLMPKILAIGHSGPLERNLHSLISIRKVGEPEGNDNEAIIARAETQLQRGNIGAALKELSTLPPDAAAVAAGWKNKAQAFLQVRGAMDALHLAIVEEKPASQPETAAPVPAPPAESEPHA